MFETVFFSTIMLPVSLAFVMLGMGMSLTSKDFVNIVLRPRAIFFGLLLQMVFLPLLAFGIATIFKVPPPIKVGLVLLASCPGGATSNLLNYLLNGNLALSVSLTTLNSFITQLTIPLLLHFSLQHFMDSDANIELSYSNTIFRIFVITLIPVMVGIFINRKFPAFSEKARLPMKRIMPTLMALALIGTILLERGESDVRIENRHLLTILPMTLLLNLGALFAGYYFSKWSSLSKKSAMTISLEVGLQNTSLAIYIATGILKIPGIALPAILYAVFSFFTSAAFGIWVSGIRLKFSSLLTGEK